MFSSFRPHETLEEEMTRLEGLRQSCPEYAQQLIVQAGTLVDYASDGNLQGIVQLIIKAREGEILQWATSNMMLKSCIEGHLAVVEYLVLNGVSKSSPGVADLLHRIVIACSENEGREIKVLPVIKFLVSKGFDVNEARSGDSKTPFHLVCQYLLPNLFKLFLVLGADIHAIDDADNMPLKYAEEAARKLPHDQSQYTDDKLSIPDYLLKLGAKSSVNLFKKSNTNKILLCSYSG